MAKDQKSANDIRQTLDQMREDYWRQLEEQTTGEEGRQEEFLLFQIDGERYGILCAQAREVLKVPRLVPVPGGSRHIAGIINLRGQILAVTDMRSLFGFPATKGDKRSRLVVVSAADLTTALLVDEVREIRSISLAEVEAVAENIAGLPKEVFIGQLEHKEGVLTLINLEKLLRLPEIMDAGAE